MKIKELSDAYLAKTVKANEIAERITWLFILIFLGSLFISGDTAETVIPLKISVTAYGIGLVQRLWQAWAIWRFQRKLEKTGKEETDGYPVYIANIAWVLFAVKMLMVLTAIGAFIWLTF